MLGRRLRVAKQRGERAFNIYHRMRELKEPWEFTEEEQNRLSGIYRKTKVPCSSLSCCGNPRRRGETTLQERIAEIKAKEQLHEILDYPLVAGYDSWDGR